MSSKTFLIICTIIILIFVYNPTKYEGRTAQEWFNNYSEAESIANEKSQKFKEREFALANEIVLKECIGKVDKFYLNTFNLICSKMEEEQKITRQQCTVDIASNGVLNTITMVKDEDTQKCFQTYLQEK